MEAGFVVIIALLAFVLGLGVGFITKKSTKCSLESQGILNIHYVDTEEPGLYLGLSVPVEDVVGRDHVTFEVNVIR